MTATISQASDEAALFHLHRELHDCEVVARFTVDGEPVSKSRARFTNRGSKTRAYTPEKTKTGEQAVAWKFKQAAPGHRPDKETAFGVFAIFFNGTRQRRDVDNMLKLILDGLNKVAWADDSQVDEVSGRRGLDLPENARTEILIYRTGRVDRPKAACLQCGHLYDTYPSLADKKFCSAACGYESRKQAKTRACQHCGGQFVSHGIEVAPKYCSTDCGYAARRRDVPCNQCGVTFSKQACHVRKQNYCSAECRDTAARQRRAKNAKGPCQTCDGSVSKRTYTQCSACRLAGLQVPGQPKAAS